MTSTYLSSLFFLAEPRCFHMSCTCTSFMSIFLLCPCQGAHSPFVSPLNFHLVTHCCINVSPRWDPWSVICTQVTTTMVGHSGHGTKVLNKLSKKWCNTLCDNQISDEYGKWMLLRSFILLFRRNTQHTDFGFIWDLGESWPFYQKIDIQNGQQKWFLRKKGINISVLPKKGWA